MPIVWIPSLHATCLEADKTILMTRSRIDRIVAAIWWILVLVVPGCYSFLIPKQQNIQRSETSLFGIPSHSRQVWREKADPSMHRDFMSSRVPGGYPVSVARDNTLQHYVYFARLNSKFCFVFNGMTQVRACRAYFARKHHPSTRKLRWRSEYSWHHMGPWYCRLPKGITLEKRKRIIKLLDDLIDEYGDTDFDFVHEKRYRDASGFDQRTIQIKQREKERHDNREDLAQEILQLPNDKMLSELIWSKISSVTGINHEADSMPHKLCKIHESSRKILSKITAPPRKTTSRNFAASKTTAVEPRPLSKFQRKRLERKQSRDIENLREISCKTIAITEALSDSLDALNSIRHPRNGTAEFREVLNEVNRCHKEARAIQKAIQDSWRAFE